MCVVEYNTGIDTNHEEVIEWGRKRANDMKDFIAKMVEVITNNQWLLTSQASAARISTLNTASTCLQSLLIIN